MSRSIAVAFSLFLIAADWPQWRGPMRDGFSPETGLLKSIPKDGPKLAWTFDKAGVGYSAPAIVGKALYCSGADADKTGDFVFAVDITTGKEIWRTPVPIQSPDRRFNTNWGGGPRCTPTVDGDKLYVLHEQGDIACLNTRDGKIVWQKNMVKDLGGKVMQVWGYSESVLVDGDRVICTPGFDPKNGVGAIAALNKNTGDVVWQSKDVTSEASYASIVISNGAGVKQYVQVTAEGLLGVRATDGKLLWKTSLGKNNVAIIPTPIVDGDIAYVTSDYGAGGGAVKLVKNGDGVDAQELWANKKMQNHHGGVIRKDQFVFGSTGNANNRKTLPFICQNMLTGEVVWEKAGTLEPSSMCLADGSFFCYGQMTGALVRLTASSKGFEETGRFTIPKQSDRRKPEGGIWTHPVIAAGKLFLRDQELLFCFELK